MPIDIHKYHYAIVSRIPESFREVGRQLAEEEEEVQRTLTRGKKQTTNGSSSRQQPQVDMGFAIQQHNEYIEVLRKLGIDVLELPADERHPACVFVADTAVVINGTALICKPKERRLGETAIVRSTLRNDLGLRIVEVDKESARIEGSDVLFTGREIFVGIGKFTNMDGAQCVAKAFPEYAVTIISLPPKIRHLTDIISMAGPEILVVSRGDDGQRCLQELITRATFAYRVIRVDEQAAANVIYANGVLLHLDDHAIPNSFPIWEAKFDNRLALSITELQKLAGTLTSAVLLVSKPSNYSKSFQTSLERGHHELE